MFFSSIKSKVLLLIIGLLTINIIFAQAGNSKVKTPPKSILKNKQISSIEKMFAQKYRGTSIKQFGYDFFERKVISEYLPVGDNYTVGPGDTIAIYLWGDPVDVLGLKGFYTLTIDREGKIYLPSIGVFYVWGLTVSKVRETLKKALSKKFKKFELEVTLGKLREFPVYVSGFVNQPGTVLATGVNSVLDVLTLAGGISKTGSLRDIILRRLTEDGVKEIHIDMYDLLIEGKPVDTRIKEGDTILVKPIGKVVGISGVLKRPAIYEMKIEENLKDIIDLAGGTLPSVNKYSVKIIRYEDNQVKIQEGILNQDFINSAKLKDGDLIKINPVANLITNKVTITGYVKYPGNYSIKKVKTLSQLLNKAELFVDTNVYYGELIRQKPGQPPEYYTFIPKDILDGKTDIELQKLDKIRLYKFGNVQSVDFNKFKDAFVLKGHIKYPGVYAYKPNIKLSDVLTDEMLLVDTNVYYGELIRQKPGQPPEYYTFIPKDILDGKTDIELQKLDKIRLYKFGNVQSVDFNKFKDAFVLKGHIKYPGVYAYKPNMKLSDVLTDEMLLVDTNVYYGELIRKELPDFKYKIINFTPIDILSGKKDITLKRMDIISFYPKWLYAPIQINGEVEKPTIIPYYDGIRLLDVVRSVKLTEKPRLLKISIFREIPKSKKKSTLAKEKSIGIKMTKSNIKEYLAEKEYKTIYLYDLLIKGDKKVNITLNPGDKLLVQKVKPTEKDKTVTILGEVNRPGVYKYKAGMKLYDLLKKAGGYTEDAYPKGLIFIRESAKKLQQEQLNISILSLEETLAKSTEEYSAAGSSDPEQRALIQITLNKQKQLLEIIKKKAKLGLGRVALDIPNRLEELKNSKENIELTDGDYIYVPSKPNYVLVLGDVYNQISLPYREGETVEYYLSQVGGLGKNANEDYMYIIKANGRVISKQQSSSLFKGINWKDNKLYFGKDFYSMKLEQGDTIVVPSEIKVPILWMPLIKDVTQIIFQALSTAVLAQRL